MTPRQRSPVGTIRRRQPYLEQWGFQGVPVSGGDDRPPPTFGAGPGHEAATNMQMRGMLLALSTGLGDFREPGCHPPLELLRQIKEAVDAAWRLPDTDNQLAARDKAIAKAKQDFAELDCVHAPWKTLSWLLRSLGNCVSERCDSSSAYSFERSLWMARSLLAIWLRVLDLRPAA